ncbi:MAG TPA: pantetheine-phosphate adenylyltransferase [Thermoplasmata archaeon]|nr:pantetheine-phosphate adenylyltransferase [Thermoplasmata archaeon]
MPRYRHAVLGGTFDHFHVGHAALLHRAFHAGLRVSIGVTTDRFLAEHPKPAADRLQPYATRRRAVVRWAKAHYPRRTVRVVPLENRFGRSIEEGVDVLVVSADTRSGGRAVNAERRRLGRRSIPLEVVPVVLADDLRPVSSRRIRSLEIDREGRRVAPLKIGLAVSDRRDALPACAAIRRVFPSAVLRIRPVEPDRTGGPRAIARARALAREAVEASDLGIGVARHRRGDWEIAESSPEIGLGPRWVRAGSAATLRSAMVRLLRPGLRNASTE